MRDILFDHIDSALDGDDLESIGDFVRSVIQTEGIPEWQVPETLRSFHLDLITSVREERNEIRRIRMRAALSYFEADFTENLFSREIDTLQ